MATALSGIHSHTALPLSFTRTHNPFAFHHLLAYLIFLSPSTSLDLSRPPSTSLSLDLSLSLSLSYGLACWQREGTLIGTSFAVSFGYWLTLSGLLYALGFIFNTNVTVLELLSITGYALSSYCLVLLASHLASGSVVFYLAWLVLGGLSALRLVRPMQLPAVHPSHSLLHPLTHQLLHSPLHTIFGGPFHR